MESSQHRANLSQIVAKTISVITTIIVLISLKPGPTRWAIGSDVGVSRMPLDALPGPTLPGPPFKFLLKHPGLGTSPRSLEINTVS